MAEENYWPMPLRAGPHPCYICNRGSDTFYQPNLTASVDDCIAGARIEVMYERLGLHAKFVGGEDEQSDVHVIVGACERHLPNLERLVALVSDERVINPAIIIKSLNV